MMRRPVTPPEGSLGPMDATTRHISGTAHLLVLVKRATTPSTPTMSRAWTGPPLRHDRARHREYGAALRTAAQAAAMKQMFRIFPDVQTTGGRADSSRATLATRAIVLPDLTFVIEVGPITDDEHLVVR